MRLVVNRQAVERQVVLRPMQEYIPVVACADGETLTVTGDFTSSDMPLTVYYREHFAAGAWSTLGVLTPAADTLVIPGTVAGQVYDVRAELDELTGSPFVDRPAGVAEVFVQDTPLNGATFEELSVRAVVGDYLYFGTCRPEMEFDSLSHEYKRHLGTGVVTDLGTQEGKACFQSVLDGTMIYTVGQVNVSGTLTPCLMTINTTDDTVTVIPYSTNPTTLDPTGDANEFQSILDDGANLIVTEQTGVWIIPKADLNNPTFNAQGWAGGRKRMVKLGTTYYCQANFAIYSSDDLTTWTLDTTFGGESSYFVDMIKVGSLVYALKFAMTPPYIPTLYSWDGVGDVGSVLLSHPQSWTEADGESCAAAVLLPNHNGDLVLAFCVTHWQSTPNRHALTLLDPATGQIDFISYAEPGTIPVNGSASHGTDLYFAVDYPGQIKKITFD